MPDLLVRLKKKTDGSAALSCMRADGSVTWQRQEGATGRFFPLHDLTHLAVESVLGHDRSFYGLLADGWNITDFAKKSAVSRLPGEAVLTELIVGFLDAERGSGERWPASDLNDKLAKHGRAETFTEEQLAAVRARRAELFAMWRALPDGDTLEVPFTRRSSRST